MTLKTIDLKTTPSAEAYALLAGAVAPRPIAFSSTTDPAGNVNVSPFSFFNLFSSNPPNLVFSPLSRTRDNTSKHTLDNVMATREVVINIANYSLVEAMSLASTEYDTRINRISESRTYGSAIGAGATTESGRSACNF